MIEERGPYNTETEITMTRSELMGLLLKLDRPESAKAYIRRGADGKEYYVRAIEDITQNDISFLHPKEQTAISLMQRQADRIKELDAEVARLIVTKNDALELANFYDTRNTPLAKNNESLRAQLAALQVNGELPELPSLNLNYK